MISPAFCDFVRARPSQLSEKISIVFQPGKGEPFISRREGTLYIPRLVFRAPASICQAERRPLPLLGGGGGDGGGEPAARGCRGSAPPRPPRPARLFPYLQIGRKIDISMEKCKSQWSVQSSLFPFGLKTKMSLPRNFLSPTAHPGINYNDVETIGNTEAAITSHFGPVIYHYYCISSK